MLSQKEPGDRRALKSRAGAVAARGSWLGRGSVGGDPGRPSAPADSAGGPAGLGRRGETRAGCCLDPGSDEPRWAASPGKIRICPPAADLAASGRRGAGRFLGCCSGAGSSRLWERCCCLAARKWRLAKRAQQRWPPASGFSTWVSGGGGGGAGRGGDARSDWPGRSSCRWAGRGGGRAGAARGLHPLRRPYRHPDPAGLRDR